jgi:prefoldin subunit 5
VFLSPFNPLVLHLLTVTQWAQMLQPLNNQMAGMQAQLDVLANAPAHLDVLTNVPPQLDALLNVPAHIAAMQGQIDGIPAQEHGEAIALLQETLEEAQESIVNLCQHIEEELCLALVSFTLHSPPVADFHLV